MLVIALLAVFSCEKVFKNLEYESGRKRLFNHISTEYNGIITKKYSPREWMGPTHITINNDISLCPSNSEILISVEVDDSVYKAKNDNYISIYRNDTLQKTLWFMKIPQKYIDDPLFPESWKGKWKESITK